MYRISTGYRRPGTEQVKCQYSIAKKSDAKLTPENGGIVKVFTEFGRVEGSAGNQEAKVGSEAGNILATHG